MTLKELEKIANKYINSTQQSLPVNALDIAFSLNIRVKNSLQAKIDFQGDSPLNAHNAIYALYQGEYTIYYDEHYAYKNFAIAHEIAHHLLGHSSDGASQHHDANLLAAIIVAPIMLVRKYKVKSAIELSEICKIPIGIAEEYWREIGFKFSFPFHSIIVRCGIFFGGFASGWVFCELFKNKLIYSSGLNNVQRLKDKQRKPPTKK